MWLQVCDAELGEDLDVAGCAERLVAKQAKKQKQSKKKQKPKKKARSAAVEASTATAAVPVAACGGRLRKRAAADTDDAGEDGSSAAAAAAPAARPAKRAKQKKTSVAAEDLARHKRTTEDEVQTRCSEAGVRDMFEWINTRDQIKPTDAVAEQYPKIQKAWEALEESDVENMCKKRWVKKKLCDQPVYLGWLLNVDHPARKNGNSRGDSTLELGVFAECGTL